MSKRQENVLLSMWMVSLVATLGSLYFSEIRGYTPCTLCWVQRGFMYPLVIIIGVAYVQKNVRIAVFATVFARYWRFYLSLSLWNPKAVFFV
jgi:disulfide bond formation protein DsbB